MDRTHRIAPAVAAAFVVALASALVLPLAAAAQTDQAPRIAVVDLEALFFSAKEGRGLRDELANLEKATKDRVEEVANRIQQMRQDAAGKPGEEQRAIARRIEDEERTARRIADDAQRQAGKMERAAREAYNERLEPLLRELQEEQDLDLILNKTPGIVVFASEAVDISQSLLAKLDGN